MSQKPSFKTQIETVLFHDSLWRPDKDKSTSKSNSSNQVSPVLFVPCPISYGGSEHEIDVRYILTLFSVLLHFQLLRNHFHSSRKTWCFRKVLSVRLCSLPGFFSFHAGTGTYRALLQSTLSSISDQWREDYLYSCFHNFQLSSPPISLTVLVLKMKIISNQFDSLLLVLNFC